MVFNKETAKAAGRKSGRVRRERLTADRVVEELGLLESVDDAMRRLDRLNVWIASRVPDGIRRQRREPLSRNLVARPRE
ncbi:MAG: hypothetical protein IIA27_15640 [Gemmatimonadetes bacterium]|nr:hypothetical protein [Gemmatimonadota bacterium]